MADIISQLLKLMQIPGFNEDLGIIPWSSPVPFFGQYEQALVATLGLNPSNLEFVDPQGNEITGSARRFDTLHSLNLPSWANATDDDARAIDHSCRLYFERNPYHTWFGPLNRIIGGTGASYYADGAIHRACHLDLVPFATSHKWTGLTQRQRRGLLDTGRETLHLLLCASKIRVLVLNGATVVKYFEATFGVTLGETLMPAWDLPRRSTKPVRGMAYRALVSRVAGQSLDRSLLVLGYNHNIQSSYGVTREVTEAICDWLHVQTSGVI